VAPLNAFLTSSKARGEQLDNLRHLLMVKSKISCVGNKTTRGKKRKKGHEGQTSQTENCDVVRKEVRANMPPSCSDRDFG
jgi:hypothetical protein